tara:strand:+ start:3864 stop:4676 length:813 start_codon:yes stop_codon:yes gene_type:complete
MNNAYITTANATTIFTGGEVHTVDEGHVNYSGISSALASGAYQAAIALLDVSKGISDYTEGQISVEDGVLYHGGDVMDNALTQRIIRMMREGFEIDPMINFLKNLMENPSGRAVQELYRFLESNNLPLTEDGCFLAYKNVGKDYMDRHTTTFDNHIGKVCSMPRNKVMDDPNQTCSAGLHFCSIEYLNSMWGHKGHDMIVKINPKDVVSIPVDYNNSKGRCSEYLVVGEHQDKEEDTLSDDVVNTNYTQTDLDFAFSDGFEVGQSSSHKY